MAAFWDIAACRLEVDKLFRSAYCLHHHGDHVTLQFNMSIYSLKQNKKNSVMQCTIAFHREFIGQ
jgi:hypothetical protein